MVTNTRTNNNPSGGTRTWHGVRVCVCVTKPLQERAAESRHFIGLFNFTVGELTRKQNERTHTRAFACVLHTTHENKKTRTVNTPAAS